MKNFKGFDDWVPVFKTGVHTDSAGNTDEWTEEKLDRIVANFDPSHHEPPAVIGHPKATAPAYAWVEGMKRVGEVLYAKFRDVVPEFADMVKRGLFKKRSISLYPDLTLRHIGFLGAVPPAIKGLPDMQFNEDDAITIEYSETSPWTWESIARIFRGLRDWLIEKEGIETADRIIGNWDIDDIKAEGQKPGDNAIIPSGYTEPEARSTKKETRNTEVNTMFKEKFKNFLSFMGVDISKVPDDALPVEIPKELGVQTYSEADVEAAKKQAADDAKRKAEADFAERERNRRKDERKKDAADWCERMQKEGRLTPALVKFGIPEMLEFMASHEDAIEFGESKEKATVYDRFKALFETELPKIVTFGETAKRDTDVGGSGEAGKKLETLTRQKMEKDSKLSYSEAFQAVQRENPDLASEYAAEIRG